MGSAASAVTETIGLGAAAFLGLIEGLTEFIPVSSTGHLILARQFLNLGEGGLAFDAALQAATALAILCYFWRDIQSLVRAVPAALGFSPNRLADDRLLNDQAAEVRAVVAAAIPIAVLGLTLDGFIETNGRDAVVVVTGLLAGALLLWLGDRRLQKRGGGGGTLGLARAALLGCFQALALWPGVSRSGATIAGGAFLGLSREAAARFSFIAGLPVLLGAGGIKLIELAKNGDLSRDLGPLLVASSVGFASGYAAIGFLMRFLRTHSLRPFVWYRIILAAITLVLVSST